MSEEEEENEIKRIAVKYLGIDYINKFVPSLRDPASDKSVNEEERSPIMIKDEPMSSGSETSQCEDESVEQDQSDINLTEKGTDPNLTWFVNIKGEMRLVDRRVLEDMEKDNKYAEEPSMSKSMLEAELDEVEKGAVGFSDSVFNDKSNNKDLNVSSNWYSQSSGDESNYEYHQRDGQDRGDEYDQDAHEGGNEDTNDSVVSVNLLEKTDVEKNPESEDERSRDKESSVSSSTSSGSSRSSTESPCASESPMSSYTREINKQIDNEEENLKARAGKCGGAETGCPEEDCNVYSDFEPDVEGENDTVYWEEEKKRIEKEMDEELADKTDNVNVSTTKTKCWCCC